MPEESTTEGRLAQLRELIASARSMPMSASCVINRAEVLRMIDDLAAQLPNEIADARSVIDEQRAKVADGEAEAARIIADAEAEAEALRREVDVFIDSRMAGFESVLHKTASQVRTARSRLAERNGSGLGDGLEQDHRARSTALPSLD